MAVDMGKLKSLQHNLQAEIFGQQEAVDIVAKTVTAACVGFCDPRRPLGSFLFLGPTGVGKSQLGRSLAKALHGEESSAIVINCTEFKNPHDVAKLVGAPPSYVGHDHPPFITPEKLGGGMSVVIFEELEKADREFPQILLQILERGELRTGRAVDLNFTRSFIILTSNLGSRVADRELSHPLGFRSDHLDREKEEKKEVLEKVFMRELERFYSPEFIGRIDTIAVFDPLDREQLTAILDKFLEQTQERCRERGIELEIEESVKDWLLEKGTNLRYGARPLRRAVYQYLEYPVAQFVTDRWPGQKSRTLHTLHLSIKNGEVVVEEAKKFWSHAVWQ